MATTITINEVTSRTEIGTHGSFIERLGEWFRVQMSIRETAKELNNLSDRELDDLGIVRCDIPSIARASVRSS